MRISSEIVKDSIMRDYPILQYGEISTDLNLEYPLLYQRGMAIEDNKVYVSFSPNLSFSGHKTSSLLISIGSLPDGARDIFEGVLYLSDGAGMEEIFNLVMKTFAYYEQWDTDLIEILSADASLNAMLNRSVPVFRNNSMFIHNTSFVNVAFSKDFIVNNFIEGLDSYIKIFKYDKEYEASIKATRASIFPAHITGSRSLYMNLRHSGNYIYRLLVMENQSGFLPRDAALLEHLAKYVLIAVTRDSPEIPDDALALPHVLRKILSEGHRDPYYINQRLSVFGWLPEHDYFCMRFLVDVLDLRTNTTTFLCAQIDEAVEGACAFEYENGISVYCNLSLFGNGADEVMALIVNLLRDNYLKAGLSNRFTGFDEWLQYYRQAELALSVGLRVQSHIWIHRFREVAMNYLLEACVAELPAHMVCAPELITLMKYDEANGAEYCLTLLTYLRCDMKIVRAAAELYIHRSTLQYRLERIFQMTGLDLENENSRLYLLLSFRLLGI